LAVEAGQINGPPRAGGPWFIVGGKLLCSFWSGSACGDTLLDEVAQSLLFKTLGRTLVMAGLALRQNRIFLLHAALDRILAGLTLEVLSDCILPAGLTRRLELILRRHG